MRSLNRTIGLLSIILIAGIGTWQWLRGDLGPFRPQAGETVEQELSAAAASRPARAAASADSSHSLQRRAIRGHADDIEGVTRAFKEARDCLAYHAVREELSTVLNDERLQDLSSESLASLERIDATTSRQLSIARLAERSCIGSDKKTLAEVYVDAIFKAALQGSPDAESCYVITGVSSIEAGSSLSLKLLEERYLKHAPAFTRNALERGDPYVAAYSLYRYSASEAMHPSRLDEVAKPDPYLTWRAARLASLRALPDQRMQLEHGLERFRQQNLLQPDEIERADAWAKATYRREFAGRPPIDLNSHVPCHSSPDLAP